MTIYSTSEQDALHARTLLKDWVSEGFLTAAQYEQFQQEAVCDLRRTNIFLRLVLFLFTLIIVAAATGLFFAVFFSRPSTQATGVLFLIAALGAYVTAELAVNQARLYRYGIEEALAVSSVACLCAGAGLCFPKSGPLVPAAGALFALWIWHRFGLTYAFPAAMVFVIFLPHNWTSSETAQHLIVAALYATGLVTIAALRIQHRFDFLNDSYSPAEACLWLGVYLAINLQLSSLDQLAHWATGARTVTHFPASFYWTTWVLTWCLPVLTLARGVQRKDRAVLIAGGITAVLTFVTNKPYLGWDRHTWDPMLLGILLIGTALLLRRWLVSGPDRPRRGFTAERLSAEHKLWLSTASSALGLVTPHAIAPAAQTPVAVQFGGGDSAGGGASSDF